MNENTLIVICIPLMIVLAFIYMLNKGYIAKERQRKKALKKEQAPEFEIEVTEGAEKEALKE